jgi:bacterial/archaeal transporter family-2 protein
MNSILYVAAALAVGICISLKPAINSSMARALGNSVLATSISISITFIFALTLLLMVGKGIGDLAQIKALPWWVIIGGIAGFVFVLGGVYVAPVIGVALFFVCVVAGQLLGATVIDQFGLFGTPLKPFNTIKFIGLFMVLAGAIVVQNSNV